MQQEKKESRMNSEHDEMDRKLRGGYYTPPDLARFLVKWISRRNPKTILEPSCGDGVFLGVLAEFDFRAKTTAIEIEPGEADKARARVGDIDLSGVTVCNTDFLRWANHTLEKHEKFDAVIGNPPFIRYQTLSADFQCHTEHIFDRLDCAFTRHTNAWVPFVLAGFEILKPGGRMAMVVPSEIIHITHARSLRDYLARKARRVVIVDPKELWFEDTLQGAVLLMAEKKMHSVQEFEGVGIHPVRGRSFLSEDPEKIFQTSEPVSGEAIAGKWTRALLSSGTRILLQGLENHGSIRRFVEMADVDVGIVTGANGFFLVDDKTVRQHGLEDWVYPAIGRSAQCPGVIYDEEQHRANRQAGKSVNFIWLRDEKIRNNNAVRNYIALGEEQGLHLRYKCRVRTPWYTVPSVYASEVGMTRCSHDAPRSFLNLQQAYTTDSAYRIRIHKGTAEQFVFGFINGLTALCAEIEGRHYGGGVLETVPSEVERLLIPDLSATKPDLAELDRIVRAEKMADVLKQQSGIVLGSIGINKDEQDELLSAWAALRDRRQRKDSEFVP